MDVAAASILVQEWDAVRRSTEIKQYSHGESTAATVIILTRKGVTGLMLKVRKFKLINGKLQASGCTYRFI